MPFAVDVVVDPDRATACSEELVRGLAGAGVELNDETARNAIRDRGMFQILDVERVVKVDLYVRCLVPGELDRSVPGERFALVVHMHGLESFDREAGRAVFVRLGDVDVPVLPLERIIVSKNATGRPKDRAILPALEDALRAIRHRRG